MRRSPLLNRLWNPTDRPDSDRCVLVVDELETRDVLSPVIIPPDSGATVETEENSAYAFSGSSAFYASDVANDGQNYRADLTAANGTVAVDATAAQSLFLSVTNDDTADVTVIGTLANIDSLLASSGATFQPDAYYSGDAAVTLTVTDPSLSQSGTGTAPIHVLPVADDAELVGGPQGQVDAPSSGFVFPPGFVAVTQWPNATGSETVTVTFSLDADDTDGFTLSAGGATLAPIESGLWQVSATSQAALTPLLDSLVLTPPTGYTGPVDLEIDGTITNVASYSDETSDSVEQSIGYIDVPLRFFVGGSVTTPTAAGTEGGVLDLGGLYTVSDPDELDGDVHTLTLSVPSGTLTFSASAVSAVPPDGDDDSYGSTDLTATSTTGPGGTTIVLTGTVAQINQFLATPGSLTYSAASPYFAGAVPLGLTLENHAPDPYSEQLPYQYGGPLPPPAPEAFTGTAVLALAPVADAAFPSATAAQTNQDTPVPLAITVSALPPDPAESVLVVLDGVPTGATLNQGTDLGGGQWALALSDLQGLVFTPPPGASGVYTLTVTAVVTDPAPTLGLVDTKSESTTFTVTVYPVAPSGSSGSSGTSLFFPGVEPSVPGAPGSLGGPGSSSGGSGGPSGGSDGPDSPSGSGGGPGSGPVVYAAYSGLAGPADGPNAGGAVRGGPVSIAQTTPFARLDAQPVFMMEGGRHTLPPVLPLDQTLPVAGFSEPAGDSFALIDMIYRDANGTDPKPVAAAVGNTTRFFPFVFERLTTGANEPAPRPASEAAPASAVASDTAPAETAGANETGSVPVAAGGLGGVLAAWFARRWGASLVRSVRRVFRTPNRQLTRSAP